MKTPNTLTAALAAFAGLSFAVAYAAPSYTPNPNSPINATPLLNSSSPLLNTYDDYIKLVDDALTGTDSLVLPTTGGATFPKAPAFVAAVAKAVHDNPGNAKQIVEAAAQYRGGNYGDKVKDILKAIATQDPALAEDAVIGAAAGNPLKVADAAAGAVLGIIASTAKDTADYGDIVDETVDLSTQALIEKIGKAAVSSAKKAPVDSPIKAVKIAKALTAAVIADGGTLYIDDLARGLVAGAAGITPSSQAEVAAGALDVLDSTAYETTKYIAEFASGALKAVKVGTSFYTSVLNALEVTSAVGSTHLSTIQAVDAAHQALRNAPSGGEATALQTALTGAYVNDLEAFMIGAVQNKPSKSGDLVTAMLTDPQVTAAAPSNAVKQAIVGAAVRGKFTNGGKVVAAAIGAGANGLSTTLAVAAAIPNATSDIAGSITTAAIKAGGTGTSNVATTGADQADDIASAAVSAAAAAGYKDAINDIALAAVKAKKLDENAIVQTLTANADSAGYREAIIAQAVIFDKKNKIALKAAADAGAVAAGSSAFERASLQLTGDLAELAKINSKTAFDDSVEDFFNASPIIVSGTPTARSQFTKAILFGRGEVNIKLAGPLLALAMKYNTNVGLTSDQMLAVAKSIYKKGSPALDIQYTVIKDALSQPDALFDLIDHATATNLAKYAPDIAAAAAAARPEYAHIVARAGSLRSPSNAGKIGAAAITYGQMKSNRDHLGNPIANPDDPAAVAAISAATILGIKDAKLPTSPTDKEAAAVKNAVGALVKAAILLQGSSSKDALQNFRQSDGTSGGFNANVSTGSAGAVTGIIAEIQGYGGSSTTSLSSLAATAITAAIKADKKHSLEIAQAASQAAQWVYQLNGGVGAISTAFRDAIVAAVNAGGPLGNIGAAVDFGISEGVANHYGAGAAGILNYAHRSGILPAVTSLENF